MPCALLRYRASHFDLLDGCCTSISFVGTWRYLQNLGKIIQVV